MEKEEDKAVLDEKEFIGIYIRLYPSKAQRRSFAEHVGASRWLYNQVIDINQEHYLAHGKGLSRGELYEKVLELKKTYSWLKGICAPTLQVVCDDFRKALKNFTDKRSNFPKYKAKHKTKEVFPLRTDIVKVLSHKLIRLGKIGDVKYRTDINIMGKKLYNPRVVKKLGKWYLTAAIECESQADILLTDEVLGIDLGIRNFAVVASSSPEPTVYKNINNSKKVKKLEEKLKYYQRQAARQRKEAKKCGRATWSKRAIKTQQKIRQVSARIANIRKDYRHQVSRAIVNMRPKRIVMETLKVKDMLRSNKGNKSLNKAISAAGFYTFRTMVAYKAKRSGIEFVLAHKYFKSSKLCSRCGKEHTSLPRSARIYKCKKCGLEIDRDFNAALNLRNY